MQPARILIVDDHPLVRSGLRQLIEDEPDLSVCCEAGSAGEALRVIEGSLADLAIIDISLPDGNGLELVKRLQARYPDVAILVSSMHDEDLFAERALKAGAKGYINKQEAAEQVIHAIRRLLEGKLYVSLRLVGRILEDADGGEPKPPATSPIERLSNRELEVYQLIGQGLGSSELAEKLHLSVKTIETYRANIKKKLNLRTANELVRSAVQWSLDGHSTATHGSTTGPLSADEDI
jgi:DNA-binding NarL/FixJ family response regulator